MDEVLNRVNELIELDKLILALNYLIESIKIDKVKFITSREEALDYYQKKLNNLCIRKNNIEGYFKNLEISYLYDVYNYACKNTKDNIVKMAKLMDIINECFLEREMER